MILTVTLNPLLESRLYYESLSLGKSNRGTKKAYNAGGKGINVSRQLNALGIENIALTFLGGNNGKIFRKLLSDEGINYFAVPTKSETRAATLAVETKRKRLTTLFEPNSIITEGEASAFKEKLKKMIQNCSIVVFSGSSPSSETDDIYTFGIELANKLDKLSVLDTYGKHLPSAIEASPTVVHNNLQELENSFSLHLSTERKKIDFLKTLYQKGVKLSFITDGPNDFYSSKFDFAYKIKQPKVTEIDPTGSGDAFVSGIIYGLEKGLVYDEFVKIGAALGAENASKWEVCNTKLAKIKTLTINVSITPIGKKLKLIDDSPTH